MLTRMMLMRMMRMSPLVLHEVGNAFVMMMVGMEVVRLCGGIPDMEHGRPNQKGGMRGRLSPPERESMTLIGEGAFRG